MAPAGLDGGRTKAALLKRHPALAGCFGCGLGFTLMHTESVILVQVMEEMRSRASWGWVSMMVFSFLALGGGGQDDHGDRGQGDHRANAPVVLKGQGVRTP